MMNKQAMDESFDCEKLKDFKEGGTERKTT